MKNIHIILLFSILEIVVSNSVYSQSNISASLKYRNTGNCENSTSRYSSIQNGKGINIFAEQICLVTIDNKSGKNLVVWVKTPNLGIKEYQIFKETTIIGNFLQIGTVPFDSAGKFQDDLSTPSQHADRYEIKTIDSSDNIIGVSEIHQTIHLSINQGLPGNYNLIWSPYVGFEYSTYYIYKGPSPNNLNLYDSIPNTYIQYSDTAASVTFYQIAVRKSSPCIISKSKSGGEPFSQSVSNLEDNLKYNIIDGTRIALPFNVYPNPFSSNLIIKGTILKPSQFKIEIFNVLGMKIFEFSTTTLTTGSYKKVIQADELKNPSQINILKVSIGDKSYYSKIIKK